MSELSGGVFEQLAKGGFYVPSAGDSGLSGTVVGDFELVRLLANGATSDVWEGVNRITREPVAVKIACRSGDVGLKTRFDHEAELLGTALESEGPDSPFPRYYGHGEYKGRPYLVTERLEDVTVPDVRDGFDEFLLEVLDAVEALHRRGYIHQDLKPTNMMRRPSNGRLVLIDFGQAHRIEEGRLTLQPNSLTMDASGRRTATGTAGYCAPEQLDAERTAFLPATDVYALGMLVRNFCGRTSEWRQVGSDATDPDLRRRIPNVEMLRRFVRSKSLRNRHNAIHDLLQDLEARRSRKPVTLSVSWEKLVSSTPLNSGRTRESGLVHVFLPGLFHYKVDERVHFTDSTVIRVSGSGTLELDASADKDIVFVLSGDVTVINRTTCQTGIDYFGLFRHECGSENAMKTHLALYLQAQNADASHTQDLAKLARLRRPRLCISIGELFAFALWRGLRHGYVSPSPCSSRSLCDRDTLPFNLLMRNFKRNSACYEQQRRNFDRIELRRRSRRKDKNSKCDRRSRADSVETLRMRSIAF